MFSGDLRHFSLLPWFLIPISFLPVCELFNPIIRLVRFAFVCVRIISFEWCITVKGMTFRIGLLATRLSISECFRGASIGFVSHKTTDCAGRSRTIRQGNCQHEAPVSQERWQTRGRERTGRQEAKIPHCLPLPRTKNRSATRDCRNFWLLLYRIETILSKTY